MSGCQRCGKCCFYHIPVAEDDIERIRRNLEPGYVPERVRQLGPHDSMINHIDLCCPFLSITRDKCGIYKHRPWICRAWDCRDTGMAGPDGYLKDPEHRVADMPRVRHMGRLFFPDTYAILPYGGAYAALPRENGGTVFMGRVVGADKETVTIWDIGLNCPITLPAEYVTPIFNFDLNELKKHV